MIMEEEEKRKKMGEAGREGKEENEAFHLRLRGWRQAGPGRGRVTQSQQWKSGREESFYHPRLLRRSPK